MPALEKGIEIKMNFEFENQGTNTYLVYKLDETDVIDTMSLGMLTNNKIAGMAPVIFTQMDNTKYIKYNVSSKISVQQLFSGSVNKKRLAGVFSGIVNAMLSAEDYMIDANSIILDMNYMFADVSTCETILISLPVLNGERTTVDLGKMFKDIVFSTQFDQTENCDYVAKLINYLNSSTTFESDDTAGNEAKNNQDTKNTEINFGVDRTLPIINIENIESKTTYATENLTVKMSIEDNLKLAKVIVELDGKQIKVWSAEELEEIVKNGGNFSFDIVGDSTDAHKLVVYAVDAAGNGEKLSDAELPVNAEEVEGFYVTTNLWVRYYTNKPLFFGSIGGVILIAGSIVFLIVYKKRKKEKK